MLFFWVYIIIMIYYYYNDLVVSKILRVSDFVILNINGDFVIVKY